MAIIPEYESAANNCVQYAEPQGFMVWNATCGHWASERVFATRADACKVFPRNTKVFTDKYEIVEV